MVDFIFIAGSPGSGKTIISKLLYEKLNHPPLFDFGILREPHLEIDWSNSSKKEEQMSFENLIYILNNYVKHGYKNIIVNDLLDFRIKQIPKIFANTNYVIISLIVKSEAELRKRVLGERDSGFKDAKAAINWNHQLMKRIAVKNEFKIDNTHRNPRKTVNTILKILKRE